MGGCHSPSPGRGVSCARHRALACNLIRQLAFWPGTAAHARSPALSCCHLAPCRTSRTTGRLPKHATPCLLAAGQLAKTRTRDDSIARISSCAAPTRHGAPQHGAEHTSAAGAACTPPSPALSSGAPPLPCTPLPLCLTHTPRLPLLHSLHCGTRVSLYFLPLCPHAPRASRYHTTAQNPTLRTLNAHGRP